MKTLNQALLRIALTLLATLVVAVAVAQSIAIDGVDVSLNPQDWFANTTALSVTVWAAVWLIRKHVWTTLDGSLVLVVSMILGVILSVGVGQHLMHVFDSFVPAFTFGIAGALLASGGLNGIISELSSKTGGKLSDAGSALLDAHQSQLRR